MFVPSLNFMVLSPSPLSLGPSSDSFTFRDGTAVGMLLPPHTVRALGSARPGHWSVPACVASGRSLNFSEIQGPPLSVKAMMLTSEDPPSRK